MRKHFVHTFFLCLLSFCDIFIENISTYLRPFRRSLFFYLPRSENKTKRALQGTNLQALSSVQTNGLPLSLHL